MLIITAQADTLHIEYINYKKVNKFWGLCIKLKNKSHKKYPSWFLISQTVNYLQDFLSVSVVWQLLKFPEVLQLHIALHNWNHQMLGSTMLPNSLVLLCIGRVHGSTCLKDTEMYKHIRKITLILQAILLAINVKQKTGFNTGRSGSDNILFLTEKFIWCLSCVWMFMKSTLSFLHYIRNWCYAGQSYYIIHTAQ